MAYTAKQMEYIDSVDGAAHQSAVRIIGELEAEIQELKALLKSDHYKIQSESRFNDWLIARGQIRDQKKRIAEFEALVNTVLLTCDPPDDFKDVEILKDHMKVCFDKAAKELFGIFAKVNIF